MLRDWKQHSQDARTMTHEIPVFATKAEARNPVERLLGTNRSMFSLYGPADDLFDDTRVNQLRRHLKKPLATFPVTAASARNSTTLTFEIDHIAKWELLFFCDHRNSTRRKGKHSSKHLPNFWI
ncbi:hypothetical protein UA74_16335 [Actinoalloteichus fjordicus]|uniref:Uncharacterized protein n=1 Tax=Actinoalloteichus fjordicus TaxID=1612552 RepID=A0AAC9LCI5_9PSEU|nr:hypothetical protein UA74_16335 [Actinoalloteichus fjordicus]